jgi:hypothetical protein
VIRRARRVSVWTLIVAAALLAGVAVRVWVLSSPLGTLDADEGIVGLMARHALDGEFSVFYWLSLYGGSQESLLSAAVFAVAGSSVVALKLVPIALFAGAAVLTWLVGRRTVGEPAARVAAALLWVWPPFFVYWTTKERGFYGVGLVCGLTVLWLTLRLRERDSRPDAALVGFAFGFGVWATQQSLLLSVPALAWLAWRRPRAFRLAPYGVGGFVLGALPWLAWNAAHGLRAVFPTAAAAQDSSYGERFVDLFTTVLPTWLGLRLPYTLDWTFGRVVGVGSLVIALVAFGIALVRRPRGLEPLLVCAVLSPFLYAVSTYTYFVAEPRYLVFVSPLPALFVARLLTRPVVAGVVLAAAVAFSVYGLTRIQEQRLFLPRAARDVRVPTDMGPLIRFLEEHGANRVLADYWVAYRLSFESDERVIATSTRFVRYPPHDRLVRRSAYPSRVFVEGQVKERLAREDLLRRGYRRYVVDGFVAYIHDRSPG